MTEYHDKARNLTLKLIALTTVVLGMGLSGGCRQNAAPPVGQEPTALQRIDIDPEILDKARLRQLWIIPKLGPTEATLKQVHYHNGRLYAVSSTNQLYVLDGQTGHLVNSTKLASDASYCSVPSFYRDHILYLAGNEIIELQQSNGKKVYSMPLRFSASTNVVRTHDAYFVGSNDGRLYCMDPADQIDKWNSVQPGAPTGIMQITDLKLDTQEARAAADNPLVKEEDLPHDLVFFACKDNRIYASWTDKRRMVWSAETSGPVAGVVKSDQFILAPSQDTALRCFDAATGRLLWKYLSGGKLLEVPSVTERHVYQRIEQKSLACLLKQPMTKLGKLKWELNNGLALLAENGQLSFVATRARELVCMDNASGKTKLSFYVPQADLFVTNTEDPTIFLANRAGSIVAIRPVD